MWIVHEDVVKQLELYDVDVLLLLMLSAMLATSVPLPFGKRGTKNDMVDVSMSVHLVLVVMVEWENVVVFVLVVLLLQDVEVHRCS